MQKLWAYISIAIFMGVLGIGMAHAQKGPQTEGAKPYTPSRLEWLALKLNAEMGRTFSQGGFQMLFVPDEKNNTIVMVVNYIKGTVPEEQIDSEIKHAKKVIELTAKARKWNSWLKVRELIKATQ